MTEQSAFCGSWPGSVSEGRAVDDDCLDFNKDFDTFSQGEGHGLERHNQVCKK